MTDERLQQIIKDTVTHSHNAAKQTDSNLAGFILGKIEPVISESIEKHVNGKIRNLDQKVTEYIIRDEKFKDSLITLIKENTDFRLRTEGSLKTYQWLFGFFGVGGIITIIKVFM